MNQRPIDFIREVNSKAVDVNIDSSIGCYQRRQELSGYFKFAEFALTVEDAREYVYSLSSRRRVHNWNDINVRLYI